MADVFIHSETQQKQLLTTEISDIHAIQLAIGSTACRQLLTVHAIEGCDTTSALYAWFTSVEMFNCIIDTVEDSSSVRSYQKFLIANFCYKYIHKTIKLTEHYNT